MVFGLGFLAFESPVQRPNSKDQRPKPKVPIRERESHDVAYDNSDARGNRKHGTATARGNRRHRHFRAVSLRPRTETRGHAARTDDAERLRTHQPSAHVD